jgi:hypothetical protein
VIPSINQGADFESCISVYMTKRKGEYDVLGRDVSVPISHPNLDLFSLGGAFEMFNLMTLLLAVLHIGVYSLYRFYLWHCVSSVASGMTRQSRRSRLGIYPSPDHQMALHWDLRIMLLFRRPTSMALAGSTSPCGIVGSRSSEAGKDRPRDKWS